MGKLAVYKYMAFMFLAITVTLTVFTLAALLGGKSSPVTNHALAMLVYALPFLIVCNAVLLVYWLVRRRWHWAVMPLFSLLSSIPYIGTFYQPGILKSSTPNRAGLKIATYNVAAFKFETSGFKSGDILSEMKKHSVDVLCLQEYRDISGDHLNSDTYKEEFPYMVYGKEDMVIYSRFPITDSKVIDFGDTNNSALWADINANGKMFRLFNVHLETTGFNRTMRKLGKMEIQGKTIRENTLIQAVYNNYTIGMVLRAHQAEQVAQEIALSPNPAIVCGDFNDVPYSYTYHTMLGDLVDGFKECGSGFMSTYRGRKKVRIDYIFHDKSLTGQEYYKQDITYSDHDPVFMKITL